VLRAAPRNTVLARPEKLPGRKCRIRHFMPNRAADGPNISMHYQ
jgi:hypothetical protein